MLIFRRFRHDHSFGKISIRWNLKSEIWKALIKWNLKSEISLTKRKPKSRDSVKLRLFNFLVCLQTTINNYYDVYKLQFIKFFNRKMSLKMGIRFTRFCWIMVWFFGLVWTILNILRNRPYNQILLKLYINILLFLWKS